MTTGSSDTRPFSRWFQVRWAERLGDPEHPYLIRWTFIVFGFSIRVHHWLRSDDRRFFHDHAADFVSVALWGRYWNTIPVDPELPPSKENKRFYEVVGLLGSRTCRPSWNLKRSIWYSKAEQRHFLNIPREGAWTLLLEGRRRRSWGFYVPRMDRRHNYAGPVRKMRPYVYFEKYGIVQKDPCYQ